MDGIEIETVRLTDFTVGTSPPWQTATFISVDEISAVAVDTRI
jgi:hypothetical protein